MSDIDSSYRRFVERTIPLLQEHGTALYEAAEDGDDQAGEILRMYKLLYRTFDAAQAVALESSFDTWLSDRQDT